MQAVILVGGKSTRTYPLTLTRPKPLLKVANKTLLEYNLEALNNLVNELILVVGYRKDMIKILKESKKPYLAEAISVLENILIYGFDNEEMS